MKRILIGAILATALTATVAPRAAMACPMCKDSISDTAKDGSTDGRGGQAGLPVGFNWSVYYMLFGLLGTTGLVVGIITKGVLSTNAQHARRGFDANALDRAIEEKN